MMSSTSSVVPTTDDSSRVDVTVPLRPEFASIVRLIAASLGADAGFSVDDIDDLRLALSEVFAALVDGDRSRPDSRVTIALRHVRARARRHASSIRAALERDGGARRARRVDHRAWRSTSSTSTAGVARIVKLRPSSRRVRPTHDRHVGGPPTSTTRACSVVTQRRVTENFAIRSSNAISVSPRTSPSGSARAADPTTTFGRWPCSASSRRSTGSTPTTAPRSRRSLPRRSRVN